MWPFKRKKKYVTRGPQTGRPIKIGSIIPVSKEELLRFTSNECPDLHVNTHACACMSCPQRVTGCNLEKIFYSAGCRITFITECSRKKSLLGQLDDKKKEEIDVEKKTLNLSGIARVGEDCAECGQCFGESVIGSEGVFAR